MPTLQVITASTREGRQGPKVAAWFLEQARKHGKFDIEAIDLAEVNLPLFDEPKHPRFREYTHEHTRAWSATIARGDAYVVVTPEYDYSAPASLINAFQYLVQEWAYKAIAFVSYGGVSGGTRGVQMSKLTATSLKMVALSDAVSIPFFAQHIDKETGVFDPGKVQADAAAVMLEELWKWESALVTLRKR